MAIHPLSLTKDQIDNIPNYKKITLILMLIKLLIEEYFKLRQQRRLKQNRPIPKELISLGLDQKHLEESNKYSKAKIEYVIMAETIQQLMEIILIFFNYYPLMSKISQKFCVYIPFIHFDPTNEYGPLTIFILLELLRTTIISTPLELYENFILEEKFGFNKMTLRTYIKDTIKTFLLWLFFMPILVSILVKIIIVGGKYFYIITEIFGILVLVGFMWIYPNYIQPLYNKFSDLKDDDLKKCIFKLAKKVDYPLKKIYVMDQSERSAHSNAYLFGFGKNKRIVLFDTLVKEQTTLEIEAVLGHELGHWKKWHTMQLLTFTIVYFFILCYLMQFFIDKEEIFYSFGFEQKSVFCGLLLFLDIYSPLMFFIDLLQKFLIRRNEYQADEFSCSLGYGEKLKSALVKLSKQNKSSLDPDPLYSFINYTHPTLVERVKAIDNYLSSHKEEEKPKGK